MQNTQGIVWTRDGRGFAGEIIRTSCWVDVATGSDGRILLPIERIAYIQCDISDEDLAAWWHANRREMLRGSVVAGHPAVIPF